MGKNQAYKAMQRARVGSSSAGPEEVEDGMMDGSFHSPEWHAARLASLKTSHTVTWEEYKKKQKEDELKKGEVEADKDRMMREYRAQLDAERASKLAHGRNHSSNRKEKSSKKKSSRKRKHSRRKSTESSESSFSDSSSDSSGSDDEDRETRRSRSRSSSRPKRKKERKHKSRNKHSSESEEGDGPLPLSKFFGNVKS
ncbi:hypothetical protein GIB67_027866 [Kingdonia uniflora]|uniref:Uncharacterized protein n=1 Tax=Kingdonia uniflora TaxID=39325 RepID=A0A7J7L4H6_9MAGN|nr:hypothetical protein GIB67_027866 [Kingdonia uniflora]